MLLERIITWYYLARDANKAKPALPADQPQSTDVAAITKDDPAEEYSQVELLPVESSSVELEQREDSSRCGRLGKQLQSVCSTLNRPTLASLLGILVGCSPLRYVLVTEDAPLRVVLEAILLLGQAAIPAIIFALGGSLAEGPGGGGGGAQMLMTKQTMAGAVVGKLVLVPMCNIGLVALVAWVFTISDKLLLVIMSILGSSPVAMNMSTITTVAGHGVHEEMATMLFWQYVFAALTMCAFTTIACVMFV